MTTIIPLGQKKVENEVFRAFNSGNFYAITKQAFSTVDNFDFSFIVVQSPDDFEAKWADLANIDTWNLTALSQLEVDVVDILSKFQILTEAY